MDLNVAFGTWEAPPSVGGPAHFVEELVKRLSDHINLTVIVPNYSTLKEKSGLEIDKISSLNVPIIRVCEFAAKAALHLRKLDIDLVHDNGVLGFSGFLPFVETWHHSNFSDREYLSNSAYFLSIYREYLTRRGLFKANSIIAISERAKKELIGIYNISSSKISVANHGVDLDFFKPISMVSYHNKGIHLLYVGVLSPRKNIASLLKALKIELKQRTGIYLTIVGDGSEKQYLQVLVDSLNLQKNVIFLGAVSRIRLLELYNAADYLVLPSYKEGFGMTLLEALACEKPVIMTPVGICDVIERNNLGVVADNFDEVSIAIAIETAINRDFHNLREYVKQNFTWEKTVDTTLEVYKQTLANYSSKY